MSENAPELDVEAIRGRLDAVGDRPWTTQHNSYGDEWWFGGSSGDGENVLAFGEDDLGVLQGDCRAEAELIAHAPADLRRLLDENARLNADRNSLAAELNERRVRASMLHRLLKGTLHSDLLATLDELSKRRPLAAPEMPRPPVEEAQEGVMSPAEEAALAIRMRHQGTCQQNGALLKMWCSCRNWEQMLLLGPSEPEVLYKAFAGHVSEMIAKGTRPAAQPGAGGAETAGTGSGRGTGVAETSGTAREEWQVRITAPDGTGIVQPADDFVSVHAAASKWRADLAESEVPYCVEPERRTVGPWGPTEEPSDG